MKIYRTFRSEKNKVKNTLAEYIAEKHFLKPCKAKSTMDMLFTIDIPKNDAF